MTTPPPGKLVSPADYRAGYAPLEGFERLCTLARQERNLAFLRQARPARVLEVGAGALALSGFRDAPRLGHALWCVVEPQPDFAQAARAAAAGDARVQVAEAYLEDAAPGLARAHPQGFDAVVLGGVLHETAAPERLLAAAVGLTAPGGAVLASLPNAQSFHRLLAVESGLIAAPDALSARDRAMGHPKVYDRASLTALMAGAGLVDLTFDGYLFKPFTHEQMERALEGADPRVLEGLVALGRAFPEQAAEICVTGRKPARPAPGPAGDKRPPAPGD